MFFSKKKFLSDSDLFHKCKTIQECVREVKIYRRINPITQIARKKNKNNNKKFGFFSFFYNVAEFMVF